MVQSYSPAGGNVSSHEGTLAPPGEYDWTCASVGPFNSTTQTANPSVQPFLHRWPQSIRILCNGSPVFPSKLPLGIWTPIHGSLAPPESSTQTASRSLQPFFQASLMWQPERPTDRLIDHATPSVTIGRMYVRSRPTAMRRNNMWDTAKPHTLFMLIQTISPLRYERLEHLVNYYI